MVAKCVIYHPNLFCAIQFWMKMKILTSNIPKMILNHQFLESNQDRIDTKILDGFASIYHLSHTLWLAPENSTYCPEAYVNSSVSLLRPTTKIPEMWTPPPSCIPFPSEINCSIIRMLVYCFRKIVHHIRWIQKLGIILTLLLIVLTFLNHVWQLKCGLVCLLARVHITMPTGSIPEASEIQNTSTHSGGANSVRCIP